MKAFNSCLKISCLLLILGSISLQAQWEKCKGPSGVNVNAITVVGDSILAGTDAGILLSTNKGADWKVLALAVQNIRSLVVKDFNIFAGTNTGTFFKAFGTTDWISSNSGIGTNKTIVSLAIKGNSILAGVLQGGVYLSVDNGATWKVTSLKSYSILSLAVAGSNIYAGILGGGAYQSADNGNTWTEVAGLAYKNVLCFAGIGGKVFAGTDNGVLMSQDNGATWSKSSTGLTPKSIQAFFIDGNRFYAGTNSGIFLSNNDGASWTAINNGLTSGNVNCIISKGSLLFAGTTGGGFVSSNNGNNWNELNTNIRYTSDDIKSIVMNGSKVYASTWAGSIYATSNRGTSWTELVHFANNMSCLTVTDSIIFAGTWGGGILSSKDQGMTWAEASNGITSLAPSNIVIDGNRIFAAVSNYITQSGGIFVSTNNGKLWKSAGLKGYNVVSLVIMDSTILAGTADKGIHLSTNNGGWWMPIDTTKNVWCLTKDGTTIYAGTNEGVFKSIDSGATWIAANNGISNTNVSAMLISGNKIFAGTRERGVLVSKNKGNSWVEINNGMPGKVIECLAISDSIIYAGTYGSSMLKARIEDLVSVEELAIPNNAISIYPNPAKDFISFSEIPDDISEANIYTIFGLKMLDKVKMDSKIDISSLPAGIYFLKAGSRIYKFAKI